MNRLVYFSDLNESASRLGMRYMWSWLRNHPQNTDSYEELFRRAFYPKAQVMLAKRLVARGCEIVDGQNPVERGNSRRAKDRFVSMVKLAIESSIIRLD